MGETKVKPVGGKWVPAEILAYHKNCDLALLRVRDKHATVKACPLAKSESYDGTAVTKCGYPGEGARHVQSSTCMGTRQGTWSYGAVISTTAVSSVPSRSGDSGGGLFRDEDHALVGVVWGKANLDNTWRLCAVPVEDIQTFLTGADWKTRDKIATPAR